MYFNESNEFLKEKVDAALKLGIHVIFCCGESLEIRDANTHESFVINQLNSSLFHLSSEELKNVTIAYEPIWAIGTGRTASSQQAEEMHACIRKSIEDKYSKEVADSISILYGGSCNASNANELFSCPNVDGGLIGGASLKASDFHAISTAY
jgi:triosephosphate isomerase